MTEMFCTVQLYDRRAAFRLERRGRAASVISCIGATVLVVARLLEAAADALPLPFPLPFPIPPTPSPEG